MKTKKDEVSEDLVASWLKLSANLRSERIVNLLTFNETHICHLLINSDMTLKEIESETNLLKSLVNRCISSLKNKGYVEKFKKADNNKTVWVRLTNEGKSVFIEQHDHILLFVNKITEGLGMQETNTLAELMNKASGFAKSLMDISSKKIIKNN